MNIKLKTLSIALACAFFGNSLSAAPTELVPHPIQHNETIDINNKKEKLLPFEKDVTLTGNVTEQSIRFSLRRDEIATSANLHLSFMASPSLIPQNSQIVISVNNKVIKTYPLSKQDLGTKVTQDIELDPQTLTNFNEIKIQFIGHYTNICENPLNSTLWLKLLSDSSVQMNLQRIPMANDLSFLPLPFFDDRDNHAVHVPVVFASRPNVKKQQAAAVLTSWFASKSQWRGFSAETFFNELPTEDAVVLVTNQQIPDFLKQYTPVTQSTIKMISNPRNPNTKLLVLWGKNDQDLLTLAQYLVVDNQSLKGQEIAVNQFKQMGQRQPYDAPNWVATDKIISFGQLKTYPTQLEQSAVNIDPMRLTLNLPPDLYALSKYTASMVLNYNYTPPKQDDESKFLVFVNNQFLKSTRLVSDKNNNSLKIQLPIRQGLASEDSSFKAPSIELGKANELRFEPYFTNPVYGGTPTQCITSTVLPNAFKISDDSTIDLTKFKHYMSMPNLSAFKNSGFPYSRMSDLSDTLIVTTNQPTQKQVDVLLNTVSLMSEKTGLPSFNVGIADETTDLNQQNKDLIVITHYDFDHNFAKTKMMDLAFKGDPNLLADVIDYRIGDKLSQQRVASHAQIKSDGAIAAVVGGESPYFKQKSVVALLANDDASLSLLNQTLTQPNGYDLDGGVAVIRNSGITNISLGEEYYVGNLSLFEILQIKLSRHLFITMSLVILVLVILAYYVALSMRRVRQKRIQHDNKI